MSAVGIHTLIQSAFKLQKEGDLEGAESMYVQALALSPEQPDCLHMLGVLRLRRKQYLDGLDFIERACMASGWQYASYSYNLVRAAAEVASQCAAMTNNLCERSNLVSLARKQRARERQDDAMPLVSILMPSYNHERYVVAALQSVFAQTYSNMEIIVIDDGSTDHSVQLIREELKRSPFPHRFIARQNQGANATINECINLANGRYVNALNSDDLFSANRIERMVQEVHHGGAEWGFARCAILNEHGLAIDPRDRRYIGIQAHYRSIEDTSHISHFFLRANPSVSTGNIFSSRKFMVDLGGFANYRYNHDWAFCLDASWRSEPVMVDAVLYHYRLHGSNTISEAGNDAGHEALLILNAYCDKAERDLPENPLALCMQHDPAGFWLARLLHTRLQPDAATRIRHCIAQIRAHYLTMSSNVAARAVPMVQKAEGSRARPPGAG